MVFEKRPGAYFDTVIVCTVTGSTHVGMITGTALEGRGDRRVIGIDASQDSGKDSRPGESHRPTYR